MATTVYFDLDGTLLDYEVPFQERFTRTVPVDPTDEMVETYSDRVLEGSRRSNQIPLSGRFRLSARGILDADPRRSRRSSSIEKSERPVSTRGATARGIASEAASVRRSHER